jgi:hypothetical protein
VLILTLCILFLVKVSLYESIFINKQIASKDFIHISLLRVIIVPGEEFVYFILYMEFCIGRVLSL